MRKVAIADLPVPIHTPEDPVYADATQVWGRPKWDHRETPLAVVQPASVSDVRAVIGAVNDAGMDFALRGTGHQLAGGARATAGLIIDMSRMSRVARLEGPDVVLQVGAGARWGEVTAVALESGGVVPAGNESSTGVVGLALGGGIGPMSRSLGLTCDRIRSVGLMGANLEHRRVDDRSDPELMAVLRGAGRGVGVVTDLELEPLPSLPTVPTVQRVVDAHLDPSAGLARWFDASERCSRETNPQITLRNLPQSAYWPQERWGRLAAIVGVVYTGDASGAEKHFRPFRDLGVEIADFSGEAPLMEPSRPWRPELCVASTAHFLTNVSETAIGCLADLASQAPPGASVTVRTLGGAIRDVGSDRSVFAHRDSNYLVIAQAEWIDQEAEQLNRAWCVEVDQVMRAEGSVGIYGNFCSQIDKFAGLRSAAYGDVERIDRTLKQIDPDGLFRTLAVRP